MICGKYNIEYREANVILIQILKSENNALQSVLVRS
jgi:hypothetical protein